MKKVFKIIKSVLGIALLCTALYYTTEELNVLYRELTQSDDSTLMFYDATAEESQILCIGASHMYCAINPAKFWESSGGVTCSIMCSSSQSTRGSYYYLMEGLKQDKSDVIFVDMYSTAENFEHSDLRTIKNLRLSSTKIKAMYDVMQTNDSYSVWDFSYLTANSKKWQDIQPENKNMFVHRPYRLSRGYHTRITRMQPGEELSDEISPEALENYEMPGSNKEYLYKMLDLCDKYPDKQVIFVRIPTVSLSFEEKIIDEVEQIVTDRGYTFIDINDCMPELGYDDFWHRGHLNFDGGEKVTAWLADYVLNNTDLRPLKDEKTDKIFADALEYYNRRKAENMSAELV